MNYSRWRRSAGRTPPGTDGLTWASQPMRTDEVPLAPSGENEFRINDVPVPVEDTNVRVTVSDRSSGTAPRRVVSDGTMYWLPSYVRGGEAYVAGTERDDYLTLSQDQVGDTILDVREGGNRGRANLGRIVRLTVDGFAGDDQISIRGDRYYGGVEVASGDDDDKVSIQTDMALKQGVAFTGGAGADKVTLKGAHLNAVLDGGAGNDVLDVEQLLAGNTFFPSLSGGSGADRIMGSAGNDVIYGGAGNDTIYGRGGNDVLWGGTGDDLISGGAGMDWLRGEEGRDLLMGGAGRDNLDGGIGDDFLYAGEGRDVMSGGEGADNLGPLVWNPRQIYAYQRVGDHLKVDVHGEYRSQPVINNLKEYYLYGKIFQKYDAAEDYLVDRNLVV
ncbi:MAG: calcium-binding protein [Spartobacteria bacterium]|nr:calcium-binding protein [Spartobacteria bacterium]